MAFYTNVAQIGNKIFYRGIDDRGRRVTGKYDYKPVLYTPSKDGSKFKSIHGISLKEIRFDDIRDAKEFVKTYKEVQSFPIYGNQKYEYSFISDNHPEEIIEFDLTKIVVNNIDIEVASENGFSSVEAVTEEVTAISMRFSGKIIVLACVDYDNTDPAVKYIKCRNEIELLEKFMDIWTNNYPDIVTGWNVKTYDIPYLYNRITKVLGEDVAKKLSPFGMVSERSFTMMGHDNNYYSITGIEILDYLELYRKFADGGVSQESYKLDNIGFVELGMRKIDYSAEGSLHRLYKDNPQKFIDYNIRDTGIIDELEKKLKLIELALTLAYNAKVNYEDVFAQVRLWTILIFNELKKDNIILPPNDEHKKSYSYEGAFVKDPIVGKHKWVVSYDFTSLYPHLIMQYCISPDCFIDPKDYSNEMRSFISKGFKLEDLLGQKLDLSFLKEQNITLTPNGQYFDISKYGFLAKMMQTMYERRAFYKKKAGDAKKALQKENDPIHKKQLEKDYATFNNLQLALKVSLNSAYGALGNQFFVLYDVRQAEAVTLAGQLSIRWVMNDVNNYLNKLLNTDSIDYIIAADTDSLYVCFDELVKKVFPPWTENEKITNFLHEMSDPELKGKIAKIIDDSCKRLAEYMNAHSNKMNMKREAISDVGIWTTKKRYVLSVLDNEGVRFKEPVMKIMGLEAIRSSTPTACREKIKAGLKLTLYGTEDEVIDFVEKFRTEFKKYPLADISTPKSLNGMEKYYDPKTLWGPKAPPQVKGALVYNDQLKKLQLTKEYETIKDGEKVKYIYLKKPNPYQSEVMSFSGIVPKEFQLEKYVDYNKQFEKGFLDPLNIVLKAIGWKSEASNSLEDLFG